MAVIDYIKKELSAFYKYVDYELVKIDNSYVYCIYLDDDNTFYKLTITEYAMTHVQPDILIETIIERVDEQKNSQKT